MNGIHKQQYGAGGDTKASCQPGIFHIHVDATFLPADLLRALVDAIGFVRTDFSGHPDGFVHFEPDTHLTLKLRSLQEYRDAWKACRRVVDGSAFVGYLEAEYITVDESIPERPWSPSAAPFKIVRRLLTGDVGDCFRQAEIHLTMDRDRSHPDLVMALLEAGLYGAYIPKLGRTDLVLTAQGTRADIAACARVIRSFLTAHGGAVGATLKEERIIGHSLHGISSPALPEVIADLQLGEVSLRPIDHVTSATIQRLPRGGFEAVSADGLHR